MKTQFTPGPWKVDLLLSDNNNFAINIPNQDGVVLLERHVVGKDQADLPNAHLIAAAPRMYEALKRVVAEYSQDTTAAPIGALIARIDNANHFIQEVLKEARGENV